MSEFLYPSYILSEDRKALMRELTNRQYKALIKCIATDDTEILETFIDNLLSDLLYDDPISVHNLTNIDKLYMLMCVRSYCIGPTIIYTFNVDAPDDLSGEARHEKKKAKVEIPLSMNEVLNRLGNYPIEHKFSFSENGLTVNGTLPKKFYYTDVVDVAVDTLSNITFEDKFIDLSDMPVQHRREVFYTLPSSILPLIMKFLENQSESIKNDPLIVFDSKGIELPHGDKIDLHMYNGTIGEIIKLLFNTELKELYTTEYTLMRRFKFTFDAIENSTPAELTVYYEVIQRDLEREKKEREEQEGSKGNQMMEAPKNLPPG